MIGNITISIIGGMLVGASLFHLGYMFGWDAHARNAREREQRAHEFSIDIMRVMLDAIIEKYDSNSDDDEEAQ